MILYKTVACRVQIEGPMTSPVIQAHFLRSEAQGHQCQPCISTTTTRTRQPYHSLHSKARHETIHCCASYCGDVISSLVASVAHKFWHRGCCVDGYRACCPPLEFTFCTARGVLHSWNEGYEGRYSFCKYRITANSVRSSMM